MPNKKTGKPTLNERRREQERIDDYNELKKFRENLIEMLSNKSNTTNNKEEKDRLNKNLDLLKNNPLLKKVLEEPVEKAQAKNLLKASDLLNAIAEPSLREHLQSEGVDTSNITFK